MSLNPGPGPTKPDAPTISHPPSPRPAESQTPRPQTARPQRAKQQRGQGQWALNHFEPLNAAERFKKDDAGLNVRDRIINQYAATGFESIDPTDLRGRFRWWGLYTQRRPGIPGGRTGMLEDEDIQDSYFMMRVRIPGGQLTSHQLRTIGGIAKEFGPDL